MVTGPGGRAVARVGQRARAWLASRGLDARPRGNGSFRLFGEEFVDPDFHALRLWYTKAVVDHTAGQEGSRLFLVVTEGEVSLESEGTTLTAAPGDGFSIHGEKPLTIDTDDNVSFVMLTKGEAWSGSSAPTGLTRIPDSQARLLAELLTATFAPEFNDGSRHSPFLRPLLWSILSDVGSSTDADDNSDLLTSARLVIEQHARDPQLTPELLAGLVGTSPRTLQRVFAAAGTTPEAEIRQERIRLARQILADVGPLGATALDEVAHYSGFRNRRQMQYALKSFRSESDPGEGPADGSDD